MAICTGETFSTPRCLSTLLSSALRLVADQTPAARRQGHDPGCWSCRCDRSHLAREGSVHAPCASRSPPLPPPPPPPLLLLLLLLVVVVVVAPPSLSPPAIAECLQALGVQRGQGGGREIVRSGHPGDD
eukprot:761113-Hanusia_phi.AAC.2